MPKKVPYLQEEQIERDAAVLLAEALVPDANRELGVAE